MLSGAQAGLSGKRDSQVSDKAASTSWPASLADMAKRRKRFFYFGFVVVMISILLILAANTGPVSSAMPTLTPVPKTHAWIAFASKRDGMDWALYLMAPDGSDVHRVSDANEDVEPAWSPD